MLFYATSQGIARSSGKSFDELDVILPTESDLLPYLSDDGLEFLKSADAVHTIDASSVNYLLPISKPNRVIIIGLNYKSHCLELGYPDPEQLVFFETSNESFCHSGGTIQLPKAAPSAVDYEGEIAIVIGKSASKISKDDAWSVVSGLSPINDVSARDVQSEMTLEALEKAKGFPTFKPFGPYLATTDQFIDPVDIRLRTYVNGELRQDGRSSDMVFSIPEIIEQVSQSISLEPGDVICTGTPSGVALSGDAPFLTNGDCVEITIENLPPLVSHVAGV